MSTTVVQIQYGSLHSTDVSLSSVYKLVRDQEMFCLIALDLV